MVAILLAFIVPATVLTLRTPLLKAPAVFYVLALGFDVLLLLFPQVLQDIPIIGTLAFATSRGMLPFFLFLVVMFIGVLPEYSKIRHYLMPIRGSLSIFAALLACGHFARYLILLIQRFVSPSVFATARADIVLIISVFLAVLLAVLTITSVNYVRGRMSPLRWRSIQKGAYVFVGIMYVHACIMLIPACFQGGDAAIRLGCYTLFMLIYVVLKCSNIAKRRKLLSGK